MTEIIIVNHFKNEKDKPDKEKLVSLYALYLKLLGESKNAL